MSNLNRFAYTISSEYVTNNTSQKYITNDWALDYIAREDVKSMAISYFSNIFRDGLMFLGDPVYMAYLLGKSADKESILTRNLNNEAQYIIGMISNEPRSCQVTETDDTDDDTNIARNTQLKDIANKQLCKLYQHPFDVAIQCLKNRLVYGVSWCFLRKDTISNNISAHIINPLQVFEHYTECDSQEKNPSSFFIVYEEYESVQYVEEAYGSSYKQLYGSAIRDVIDSSYGDVEQITLLGDVNFKDFICENINSCNNSSTKEESNSYDKSYTNISVKDSGGKYRKVKVSKYFNGSIFVRHVFSSFIEKDGIEFDREEMRVYDVHRTKCMHRVYIGGDILVQEEVLDYLPMIRLGKKVVSHGMGLYGYRGLSYNVQHLLIMYCSIYSKLVDSINNSLNKKVLSKLSVFKNSLHNKSIQDNTKNSSGFVLLQDNRSDRNISADILPINTDIVDRSSIEAIQFTNQEIRLSCGIMDLNKLSDSAIQDRQRIILQTTCLNIYASEVDAFMKRYAEVSLNTMGFDIDYMLYQVDVSLDKYSDTFKNQQLGKLIQASRMLGGISLPIDVVLDLVNMDSAIAEKVIESMVAQQEAGTVQAKQEELNIQKTASEIAKNVADVHLKEASAKEKIAKAKIESKAKSPIVSIKA